MNNFTQNKVSDIMIDIQNVSMVFQARSGAVQALQNANLQIRRNEFITVVGPSGCGKSTLLNILAGLLKPSSGQVLLEGRPITGPGSERGVVFQQYALFPWMTVRKNVEYGLKFQGHSPAQRREIAQKYLALVGLCDFSEAYPKELSGGMRQRVAIARAYAADPKVLLLDEPFGALDAQTRAQLQENLLETWQQERKTCFFITHDVEEAILLGQRVVMMSARPGHIKQVMDIPIPYPRNQETKLSPLFNSLKNALWAEVYQEYLDTAR